jgi:hypothetical protein
MRIPNTLVEDLYLHDFPRLRHPVGLDRQDHAERTQALTTGGGIDSATEVAESIPNVLMPFTGLFENSDKSKIRSPPQAPSIGMAVAYFQEPVMQVK